MSLCKCFFTNEFIKTIDKNVTLRLFAINALWNAKHNSPPPKFLKVQITIIMELFKTVKLCSCPIYIQLYIDNLITKETIT